MAERWSTFKIGNFLPSEVRDLAALVTDLTGVLSTFLSILKAALELSKLLAATASIDPIEAALRATIAEIEAFIDALTKQTAAHAILIPIQKQPFGLGQPRPSGLASDADELIISFDQLVRHEGAFFENLITNIPPETITFINSAETAVGGNQGFWRSLMLSLRDEGDPNRPQFPDDFAVAGICLIFGADNLKDLQAHFDVFNTILQMGNRSDLAARTRPQVENVRAIAVAITDDTPARIGVQVDWDPVPPAQNFPLYSNETQVLIEIFVIRSENRSFRERFAWAENFSRQPTSDANDLQEEELTKVIARIRNDGLVTRHIDDDAALVEGRIYYYGTAIRYSIAGVIQPMSPISNVVKIQFTNPQDHRTGTPPDWWATPSLIQLFPALEAIINRIRLAIASLGSRTLSNSGIRNMIDQTIQQIAALIAQADALVAAINGTTARIAGLLDQDLGGISSTNFSVSKGGIQGWTAELGRRLSDTEDPTRPAFDNAELVAGVIIVAGAPNLIALTEFQALLNLFFGSSTSNPLLTAIAAVETEVRAAETIIFDDGLGPTRVDPATVVPEESPRVVFDETMTPAETVECE